MTAAVRYSNEWMMVRVAVDLAMRAAVAESKLEPHKLFWLHAVRCPGCHRHSAALSLTTSDHSKPKYVLATIVNGEVIPRMARRH